MTRVGQAFRHFFEEERDAFVLGLLRLAISALCTVNGPLDPQLRAALRRMNACIAHRGPDGDGFHDIAHIAARIPIGLIRLRNAVGINRHDLQRISSRPTRHEGGFPAAKTILAEVAA